MLSAAPPSPSPQAMCYNTRPLAVFLLATTVDWLAQAGLRRALSHSHWASAPAGRYRDAMQLLRALLSVAVGVAVNFVNRQIPDMVGPQVCAGGWRYCLRCAVCAVVLSSRF